MTATRDVVDESDKRGDDRTTLCERIRRGRCADSDDNNDDGGDGDVEVVESDG